MKTSPLSTRSVSKSNKIEYCEHVVVVMWDTKIGHTIDIVISSDCTKGLVIKFLKFCATERLKIWYFKGQWRPQVATM